MITEPYLKIFIAYPKSLDATLEVLNDRKEIKSDSSKIALFKEYTQIKINDKKIESIDFSFAKHNDTGEKGVLSYLPKTDFKIGKNILEVTLKIKKEDNLSEKKITLPFWYFPEKY